jgi:hypothetical protein
MDKRFSIESMVHPGWAPQELIAPAHIAFFSLQLTRLGDKQSLEKEVHEITWVQKEALRGMP